MSAALSSAAWAARVAEGVERIRSRIADAGGDLSSVDLVAVTKGQPAAAVRAAAEAGLLDLGESYAQELVAKVAELDRLDDAAAPGDPRLAATLRWHLIGRLQRNKVRVVAPSVHLWQSVDRLSLAAEIARRAPGASILVQVNSTGAEQQGGVRPEQVAAVVEGCADLGLDVRGLMTIGPRDAPDGGRGAFRLVRDLADRLALPIRSMGMSGDLEAAVAEGSTLVRIGTALFGPREGREAVGN